MHTTRVNSIRMTVAGLAAVLITAAPFLAAPAEAQVRHDRRDHDRARYRTPHWVLDSRFHHNHYYPSVGYSLRVLPAGHLAVTFRGSRYFYNSGVWFQLAGPGYSVVRPPPGVVLPVLPPAYTTVWVGGAPYYYANDVYYTQAPGGYAVAAPPMDVSVAPPTIAPAPVSPPAASAPVEPPPQLATAPGAAGQPAAGMWYYCESANGYYPYVPACREGWRTVPATPPRPQ